MGTIQKHNNCINITSSQILRPVFCLKYKMSETGFSLHLQAKVYSVGAQTKELVAIFGRIATQFVTEINRNPPSSFHAIRP
jgi:hypothetical protein